MDLEALIDAQRRVVQTLRTLDVREPQDLSLPLEQATLVLDALESALEAARERARCVCDACAELRAARKRHGPIL